jgi:hypothetical protein
VANDGASRASDRREKKSCEGVFIAKNGKGWKEDG